MAATDAKDLGGPLGGDGGGLVGPAGAGTVGGFADGLCLDAARSGIPGGASGGGGGGGRGGCCCGGVDSMAETWSSMVTSLETAVGGDSGGVPLCLGMAKYTAQSVYGCGWIPVYVVKTPVYPSLPLY